MVVSGAEPDAPIQLHEAEGRSPPARHGAVSVDAGKLHVFVVAPGSGSLAPGAEKASADGAEVDVLEVEPEQGSQGGEAGCDEVDARFCGCPRHHVDAVPGNVGEDVIVEEVDEANDGPDDTAADENQSAHGGSRVRRQWWLLTCSLLRR